MKNNTTIRIKKLGIGDKFRTSDGYLNHIVAVAEDGDNRVVTYKYWSKYKKRWGYAAIAMDSLLYLICIMNDVPKPDRIKFFEVNGEKYL